MTPQHPSPGRGGDPADRSEARSEFLSLGVATLYEASGLDIACDPGIRPAWPGASLCGPAFPVRCHPADNLPIHHAVERTAPGDVLVIDCGGWLAGYFGDVLATFCRARGVAGVVIDGGTRDVDALAAGFPVFSRGVSVRRTSKHAPGLVGVPIVCAGVPLAPGDLVVGDVDGVAVIPAGRVPDVLEAARARAQEERIMAALRAGQTTVKLYDLPRRG